MIVAVAMANRARFILEVVKEASEAIGKEKVGIRFSPYGVASYMEAYPEIDETYTYLAKRTEQTGYPLHTRSGSQRERCAGSSVGINGARHPPRIQKCFDHGRRL